MTAVAPDRLGLVMTYAEQLGRRPTSNEIRTLLHCGRATANNLLEELAQMETYRPVGGPTLLPRSTGSEPPRAVDQREATGPEVAQGWLQPAPYQPERGVIARVTGWFRPTKGPLWTTRPEPAPQAVPPVHRAWLLLLALPAFVAVWGGWVGLGGLAGFGPVELLPGIWPALKINLAVTLPAGMEVYAVIGLRVWLSSQTRTNRTRRFAARSTCAALLVGCSGQVAYHVLARPVTGAPMFITVCVACLPVLILGMGAALFHLVGNDQRGTEQSESGYTS